MTTMLTPLLQVLKMSSPASLTALPLELQLSILEYCLSFTTPIHVSGFKASYSYTHSKEEDSDPRFPIRRFPILQVCKLYAQEGSRILFADNVFLFTSPLSNQWSYARDWYWTFTYMTPATTAKAMDRMRQVRFKCDGSLDGSLVGTVMSDFKSVETLEFDFVDSWRLDGGIKKYEDVNSQLVNVVWRDIHLDSWGRTVKFLSFSGLKVGGYYWSEVVTYGERITGKPGSIENYTRERSLRD
jgi:hypothetical protein